MISSPTKPHYQINSKISLKNTEQLCILFTILGLFFIGIIKPEDKTLQG